ncbi:MAG TPA: BON domain-containing protein [Pirellulales bacterium]|nr:BON domain-containing protein [Pirellulales bacterium]
MGLRSFVRGAAIGAVTMYFYDPQHGRRRRAVCEDQFRHLCNVLSSGWDMAVRDLSNRTSGLVSMVLPSGYGEVDDDVLVARVRARLGHAVTHPHAIEVHAHDGYVTLKGAVLRHELEAVIRAVASTPGVRDVEPDLEIHEEADIQPLQGGRAERSESEMCPLSPASRLLTLVGGVWLASHLTRRPITLLGTMGIGLAVWPIITSQMRELEAVDQQRRQSSRRRPSEPTGNGADGNGTAGDGAAAGREAPMTT